MILRPCPFCAKEIPRAITVCPYCHRDEKGQPSQTQARAQAESPANTPYFEDDFSELASEDPYIREQAVVRMAQKGFGIVQALIAILSDHAKPGLAAVAKTLGIIRDRRAIDVLAQAARMGDGELRTASVWALTQFSEPEVLPILLVEADRPPAELQSYVAYALGRFADVRAIPVLDKLARHANREVAFQAVCALGESPGPASVAALRRALQRRDPLVQAAAKASLRRLGASSSSQKSRWVIVNIVAGLLVGGLLFLWFFYK
jgi:hypothetical protein